MGISKILKIEDALSRVKDGMTIMMGEFVGVAEPIMCIEKLIEMNVKDLTLITNTPGMPGFGKAKMYEKRMIKELISSHVGTTPESTVEYLNDRLTVKQFFPMGTWAEKVRAGAVGLGGVLVPVGVGILDNIFTDLNSSKEIIEIGGKRYFVEPALTAEVSIIKAWRADKAGNLQYRGTSRLNNTEIAMAGGFTIAEVNEIVEVGEIPPKEVGTPGPFVDAIVQGYTTEKQDDIYRQYWLKAGKLD
jgi:acetate CoA/acetoacetate CoA-transferase alpha subunit